MQTTFVHQFGYDVRAIQISRSTLHHKAYIQRTHSKDSNAVENPVSALQEMERVYYSVSLYCDPSPEMFRQHMIVPGYNTGPSERIANAHLQSKPKATIIVRYPNAEPRPGPPNRRNSLLRLTQKLILFLKS